MAETLVGLLRGVNVGKANRVAMADLRSLVADLGFSNVRTLLNSGNVVFDASGSSPRDVAPALEAALLERLGVASAVVVVSAVDLERIIAENPLTTVADNPARLLVTFVRDAASLGALAPLTSQAWEPEALAVGSLAAYLWCPGGVTASALVPAAARALAGGVSTTRNWATVLKLGKLAGLA